MNPFQASLLICALLLAGCATRPKVSLTKVAISSFAEPNSIAPGQKYSIYPSMEGVDASDPMFREVAAFVEKALLAKGLVRAPSGTGVNIIVGVSYLQGDPLALQSSYTRPVMGVTGGGVSTFNATTTSPGGTTSTRGSVSTPLQFGVTGYTSGTTTKYLSLKQLRIQAHDLSNYGSNKEIKNQWEVTAKIADSSFDLRAAIPILVAASQDYIGRSSRRVVDVEIRSDSETLRRLMD